MALKILSFGILASRAARTADLSLGLKSASGNPSFAETVISLLNLENSLERCLSAFPFLCLMPAQCE